MARVPAPRLLYSENRRPQGGGHGSAGKGYPEHGADGRRARPNTQTGNSVRPWVAAPFTGRVRDREPVQAEACATMSRTWRCRGSRVYAACVRFLPVPLTFLTRFCTPAPPHSAKLARVSPLRNIQSVAHNVDAASTCGRFVMLRVGAAGAPTTAKSDIPRHTSKAPSGRSDSSAPPGHERGVSASSIRILGANDPRTPPASSRPLQHKDGTRSAARTTSRGYRARIAASGAE